MPDKKIDGKKEKNTITYFQYFIVTVIVIALAVLITVNLMSCSLGGDLQAEIDKVSGSLDDITPSENMTLYLSKPASSLNTSKGRPVKIWIGEFKEGKVIMKVMYQSNESEVLSLSYSDNTVTWPISNTTIESLTFSQDKSYFHDGYTKWERVNE